MTTFSAPGIFNVLDPWLIGYAFGMKANDSTPATAMKNAQVLQAIIGIALCFSIA
jgi:hypothetical protein